MHPPARRTTASRVLRAAAVAALVLQAACDGKTATPTAPADCTPPPSGLLAWYRFDETAGDAVADFGNTGARSGLRLHGASHVAGRVEGGIRFTGDTAYAGGGANKNLGTGDFSIAFWVRQSPGESGFDTVLDKRVDTPAYRGYHLLLAAGSPLIQLADAGVHGGWYNYHSGIPGQAVADGNWHFLVVTVQRASRDGLRWYLDGVPAGGVGDPTDRQGSLSNDAPLLLGRHAFFGGSMDGELDEFQIIDRVLTPQQVSTLYAKPTCR